MTVVMVVLKGIWWLLLAVLLLLLAALLIPVTADLCYEKGRFTAALRVIGLRFSVYPFKEETAEKKKEKDFLQALREKKQKSKPPQKPLPKSQKENGESTKAASTSEQQTPKPAGNLPAAAADEKSTQAEQKSKQKPVDFVRSGAQLQTLVCTAGSVMRKVLAGLKIHQICIVLPISRQDAAATALAVGRTHAMLHTSLGVLRNFLNLHFKQLVICPDYTGEHKGEEHFSCKITTHLIIMIVIAVWALLRLKKEKII